MKETTLSLRSLLFMLLMCCSVCLSCSSIDCPVQNTVYTVCQLNDTLKDTLTISTTRLGAKGGDTILLNKAINQTSFKLPISYKQPVDRLVFSTQKLAVTDTVLISKNNIPHFESVDCGLTYFHEITSVSYTKRGIDSIVILKPTVDYDPKNPHLCIYFKARN